MGVTVTKTKTKTIIKTKIGTKTHLENLFLPIIFTDMRKLIGFDDYVDGDEDAGKGNDKDDKEVMIKS